MAVALYASKFTSHDGQRHEVLSINSEESVLKTIMCHATVKISVNVSVLDTL